jgi:pyruvate dehydrogenase E2 component (dihydrolipoamide acetyltransferase)
MAEIIRMPRMSDTMEEGVIASWLKKVGDEVRSGDVLAEVETDKATMELEAYDDGVLLYIGVEDKQSVPVDGVLAIIGEKNEDINTLIEEVKSEETVPREVEAKTSDKSKAVVSELSEVVPDQDSSQINATVITMPKMSDTMTEGTIAAWHKKVGEEVKSGDILAEVETDKATMELEAYEDGTLLYIGVKDGDSIEIDGIIAVIGEKGADFQKLIEAESRRTREVKPLSESELPAKEAVSAKPVSERVGKQQATVKREDKFIERKPTDGRVKASPLARKLAMELGYDLSKINGSGEFGRIIKRDVEAHTPAVETTPYLTPVEEEKAITIPLPQIIGEESFEEVSVSQMRKTIAKRLSESKFSSPHFYLTMEINMDKAIEARKSMNEIAPVKISFNDLIIKAAASSLRKQPKVNASWLGDKIRYNKHIHIGVAVAVEEGLLVPVVRFADNKSISHIAVEVKELGEKARNKQLQPSDWEGNTFTISNLGMFGIEEFTAIINPPDACIMAVGGIKETAIVKDGQLIPGSVMKVTLSCDHRVVDGATGAAFLQTFKEMLEDPIRILV